ncbi:hypothetical protein [Streptomyces sp. NPDC059593]|uniref:hypothetical protein n=1 Tax=Streptomyces sp. NPDC059593 TaxID=3346878 RepID=UPI0036A8B59E
MLGVGQSLLRAGDLFGSVDSRPRLADDLRLQFRDVFALALEGVLRLVGRELCAVALELRRLRVLHDPGQFLLRLSDTNIGAPLVQGRVREPLVQILQLLSHSLAGLCELPLRLKHVTSSVSEGSLRPFGGLGSLPALLSGANAGLRDVLLSSYYVALGVEEGSFSSRNGLSRLPALVRGTDPCLSKSPLRVFDRAVGLDGYALRVAVSHRQGGLCPRKLERLRRCLRRSSRRSSGPTQGRVRRIVLRSLLCLQRLPHTLDRGNSCQGEGAKSSARSRSHRDDGAESGSDHRAKRDRRQGDHLDPERHQCRSGAARVDVDVKVHLRGVHGSDLGTELRKGRACGRCVGPDSNIWMRRSETLELRVDAPDLRFRGRHIHVDADALAGQSLHACAEAGELSVYPRVAEANVEAGHRPEGGLQLRPQAAREGASRVGSLSARLTLCSLAAGLNRLRERCDNLADDGVAHAVADDPSGLVSHTLSSGEDDALHMTVEGWGDRFDGLGSQESLTVASGLLALRRRRFAGSFGAGPRPAMEHLLQGRWGIRWL